MNTIIVSVPGSVICPDTIEIALYIAGIKDIAFEKFRSKSISETIKINLN